MQRKGLFLSPQKGLTLIELMVTLAIVATVLSLAILSLRGYIPKQRLISSTGYLENLAQQAQTEANARSYWTCIKFTTEGDSIKAQIFVDNSTTANTNHGSVGACDSATGDTALTSVTLKSGVSLAYGGPTCGTLSVDKSCVIWFDTTGAPKICNGSGTMCGSDQPTSGCSDATFQIVLTTTDLDAGARARELEIMSGGLIQAVKPGEKGLAANVWARNPSIATATGECE